MIRGLDLSLETRGNVPNERIVLGFAHDTMKNHYLMKAIKRQLIFENKDYDEKAGILGTKYIVEDEVLVRFLSDEVREDDFLFKNGEISFKEALKREILKTKNKKKGEKENEEEKEEVEKIIAAANAMTILVAADVNFIAEDLSGIKIRAANLRDGNFFGCDFSDADLTEVIMENCKLEGTLFNGTILKNIKLGIYPDIMVGAVVYSCCFSGDGLEVLSGADDNTIKLWDKGSGKMLNSLKDIQILLILWPFHLMGNRFFLDPMI